MNNPLGKCQEGFMCAGVIAAVRRRTQVTAHDTAHISAVLTNLDWTIERARKGIKELCKADAEEARNAELALADLLAQLEPVRNRFFQDSYFPADTSRLL